MRLVEEMRHMPEGRLYALHGYALLASKVFRPSHLRCKASKLPTHKLDTLLHNLATRPDASAPDEGDDAEEWPDYFDFATPARAMFAAMRERCLGARLNQWCHHVTDLPMLDCLQQGAYNEIRTKVFLTAGTLLPVELTEQIFVYAMQAEEMPMFPQPGVISAQESVDRVVT